MGDFVSLSGKFFSIWSWKGGTFSKHFLILFCFSLFFSNLESRVLAVCEVFIYFVSLGREVCFSPSPAQLFSLPEAVTHACMCKLCSSAH